MLSVTVGSSKAVSEQEQLSVRIRAKTLMPYVINHGAGPLTLTTNLIFISFVTSLIKTGFNLHFSHKQSLIWKI